MSDQEVRELACNIHNVRCNLSLVAFAFGLLAEIEKLLNHLDDETFFFLAIQAA